MAGTAAKIPREVIDYAATNGTVLVLVGLNVPWQIESDLNEEETRVQREAIAAIQSDLLTELEGKSYKVIRRYDRIPGIALEVGADVLAAMDGSVLVLAGLRTPWQREEQLSEDLKALQRKAILSVQSYVLAELGGTQFKVMRLYRTIPGIALRVGLDALRVLENSPAVTNVVPDRPASTSR